MNVCSVPQVIGLLKQNGISPLRQLGQNFLVDENILHKISHCAGVTAEDCVLEIGPGLGALTRELCGICKSVAAVEIDGGMVRVLGGTLSDCPNASIIHADFLKFDLARLPFKRFSVVANLPYCITTPVIMKLLDCGLDIPSMTLLVQKEVGYRLAAQPGGREYGSLSIAAQYAADFCVQFKVPPTCFYPQPAVESVVIRLTPRQRARMPKDEKLFFALVRCAFAMRRKTLANNLAQMGINRAQCESVLDALCLPRAIRGEALSVEQFIDIADALHPAAALNKNDCY